MAKVNLQTVKPIVQKLNQNGGKNTEAIQKQLLIFRNELTLSTLLGDYKGYKTAVKNYADLGVDNFELIKQLPKQKINVPLFSKEGRNFLKIWFLNLFRRKTPNEKLLGQMGTREKMIEKYLNK